MYMYKDLVNVEIYSDTVMMVFKSKYRSICCLVFE